LADVAHLGAAGWGGCCGFGGRGEGWVELGGHVVLV
jgi:hypothetical protein